MRPQVEARQLHRVCMTESSLAAPCTLQELTLPSPCRLAANVAASGALRHASAQPSLARPHIFRAWRQAPEWRRRSASRQQSHRMWGSASSRSHRKCSSVSATNSRTQAGWLQESRAGGTVVSRLRRGCFPNPVQALKRGRCLARCGHPFMQAHTGPNSQLKCRAAQAALTCRMPPAGPAEQGCYSLPPPQMPAWRNGCRLGLCQWLQWKPAQATPRGCICLNARAEAHGAF